MKHLLICLALVSILSTHAYAQNRANNWYFGNNAGLNFNTNPPSPLLNGAMNIQEGSSSISDQNGNLLFYTDGITIWDKTHGIMQNGTGLFGDGNSSQAALIVPQPDHDSMYYVFTADYIFGTKGINYSTINMNQNNGNGAVVVKNSALLNSSCEKISAVDHANGKDVWIISHTNGNNEFHVFLLTGSGLQPPVVTAVGTSISGNATGEMKASPNGRYIAYAGFNMNLVEIFDFDNSTGVVSNPVTLIHDRPWGISFSPDNSKFYIGEHAFKILFQYTISCSGLSSDIANSQIQISSSISGGRLSSMQLAPDGKIYLSKTTATELGVIHSPNLSGLACNYADQGVALGGPTATHGLPNLNQSYFNQSGNSGLSAGISAPEGSSVCVGDTIILVATGGSHYNWATGTSCSDCDTIQISPIENTIYTVVVTDTCGVDTVSQEIFVNEAPDVKAMADTTICPGSCIDLMATGAVAFDWYSNGNHLGVANTVDCPVDPTSYVVRGSDSSGCTDVDTMSVFMLESDLIVNAGEDKFIMAGNAVVLDGMVSGAAEWQWYPEGEVQTPNAIQPVVSPMETTIYLLQATDSFGCYTEYDSVIVNVQENDDFFLPNAITINGDMVNDKFRVLTSATYTSIEFKLYNRYGEPVLYANSMEDFETLEYNRLEVGVYVYDVRLGYSEEYKYVQNTLTIIR